MYKPTELHPPISQFVRFRGCPCGERSLASTNNHFVLCSSKYKVRFLLHMAKLGFLTSVLTFAIGLVLCGLASVVQLNSTAFPAFRANTVENVSNLSRSSASPESRKLVPSDIFVGVLSHPGNTARRENFRKQCAPLYRRAGVASRIFVGRPSEDVGSIPKSQGMHATSREIELSQALLDENRGFGDMVLGAYREHYRDLTDKGVLHLSTHDTSSVADDLFCTEWHADILHSALILSLVILLYRYGIRSGAEFIVKNDDDQCLNVTLLLQDLQNAMPAEVYGGTHMWTGK